jgi:hypothetical protein
LRLLDRLSRHCWQHCSSPVSLFPSRDNFCYLHYPSSHGLCCSTLQGNPSPNFLDLILSSFIPAEWRPDISVRMLPAVESILYGANLSNILSKHTSPLLDVFAWLPYGIIHFGAPVVCAGILFLFGPPGTLPVFARSFGYMSLTGVLIQLLFPCSPPCMPPPKQQRK